ncbi:hypothetical protein [Serratia sp. UGAL515B_01]|uniref:hypothetical protein n=1 Tax=Serratia sp. UGAL515B_01 TaxID=2986763 RepID=UPI002954D8E9|nr:hypothetical protein [Serratia sp. UGAL515B_01]WON76972.1 hypothetical protein OK023_17655 [Serratia sp. UGAL515B_01]
MNINSRWNNRYKEVQKKLQQGLSLIEAAMVLALSAVVVAGVMAYYQSASTNEKLEKTIGEIMAIISAVNSTYSSAPDFSDLSDSKIAKTGALPASFIDNTDPRYPRIKSPFGYSISLTGGGGLPDDPDSTNNPSSQYYSLTLAVPRSVCAGLIRLDLGSNLVGLVLASGNKPLSVPIPVSVEQSQQFCEKAEETDELKGEDMVVLAYILR